MKDSPGGHRLGAWSGLLRVPAQAIHRRIIRELNATGFDELGEPHMAMLQFPGPDGVRPSALAERIGMSKIERSSTFDDFDLSDYYRNGCRWLNLDQEPRILAVCCPE